jgi:large repetitive protein
MKTARLLCLFALAALTASPASAASEQSALLSVFGPASAREPSAVQQVIWLAVPTSTADSTFLRIFDADCGGRWDVRRGKWNTDVRYRLYAAPRTKETKGDVYVPPHVLPADLGTPIAVLSIRDNDLFDAKWHTLTALTPSAGLTVGKSANFLFVAETLSGNEANRFDIELSTSRKGHKPIAGSAIWTYNARFRIRAERKKSAELRFRVPEGTKAIAVTMANAEKAKIVIDSPSRSGIELDTRRSPKATTRKIRVRHSEQAQDWAVVTEWLGTGFGDVTAKIADQSGAPLPLWLPIGISHVNFRPKPRFRTATLPDCGTVMFDASGSSDPDRDLLKYAWDFGDGATGTGVRVTHTFASPGKYRASLVVTDPNERVNSVARLASTVTINRPPVARFTAPSQASVGQVVILDGSGSSDEDGRIKTWTWDLGDGTRASGQQVKHRYERPGTYTVELEVVDNSGIAGQNCRAARHTERVFVNASPVARIHASLKISPRETMTLDGSGSADTDGFIKSFQWDFGDGKAASGRRVTHEWSKPGSYTVKLAVTDNSSTSTSLSENVVVVRVNARPTARAGRSRRIAVNQRTRFDGRRSSDPDGRITSHSWDFGDGSTSKRVNTTHRYDAPGTYKVRLTVTDNSGTSSAAHTDTISVTVNARPVANAGPDQRTSASTITLNASGSRDPDGKITRYSWDFGDSDRGNGMVVKHTYRLPGTYEVHLAVRDNSGTRNATAKDTTVVIINEYPVADMGWSRETISVNEPLQFDGSASLDPDGSIESYLWDFGDGETATGPTATHTWDSPGRYRVSLRVTDNSGDASAVGLEENVLKVNAPPVASISKHSGHAAAPGKSILFDATHSTDPDGQIVEFEWQFGDGTPTVRGRKVRHSFARSGVYTVRLTVRDDSGVANCVAGTSMNLRVNARPIARMGEDRFVCSTTQQFTAKDSRDPDGDRLSFRWTFGKGKTAEGPTVVHTFARPGRHIVRLAVIDGSGATNNADSTSIVVRINAPPMAHAGQNRSVCAGETLILSAEKSRDPERGPLRYEWDFGDGTRGKGATPTHTYARPRTYRVVLAVKDNSNLPCNMDTDAILVRVSSPPVVKPGKDRKVCAGETVEFDGTGSLSRGSPIKSYEWDFGDGTSANGPVVTHVYTVAGSYAVKLTVSSDPVGSCGYTDTGGLTVEVEEAPKATFLLPHVVSLNRLLTFDASRSDGRGSRIVGYLWEFGDGSRSNQAVAKHSYTSPGRHVVKLRVTTSAQGRCNVSVKQRVVSVNAPPVASAGRSRVVSVNELVNFDGSSSSDPDGRIVDYSWTFGDGATGKGISPTHTYTRHGRYTVSLSVKDNSGVARDRCVDSLVVKVNSPPVPIIIADSVACPGQRLTFDGRTSRDPDGNIGRYQWSFGDGTTGDAGMMAHAYQASGVYQVTLTVVDNSGAANHSASRTILVHVNHTPVADAGPDIRTCTGTRIVLNGARSTDRDGDRLAWSWNVDGKTLTGKTAGHTFERPGKYPCILTVVDGTDLRCNVSRDTVNVLVNSPPLALVRGDTTIFVGGAHDNIWFDATNSTDADGDRLTFLWDFGDESTAEGGRVRHMYLSPGTYRVTLTVDDGSGTRCSKARAAFTVDARMRPGASAR